MPNKEPVEREIQDKKKHQETSQERFIAYNQQQSNFKDFQSFIENMATAIRPLAPMVKKVREQLEPKLTAMQNANLIKIEDIFTQLSHDVVRPDNSRIVHIINKLASGMKKLGKFIEENSASISTVASILLPAIKPVSLFLTKAIGFLMSSVLAPGLQALITRATHRAKQEVEHVENSIQHSLTANRSPRPKSR